MAIEPHPRLIRLAREIGAEIPPQAPAAPPAEARAAREPLAAGLARIWSELKGIIRVASDKP